MKTKIYLNDWFFNSGIVGFLRILDHNQDNFVEINENCITFETKKLKNFHKQYFKYFFDKYNIGNRTKERIEKLFERIKTDINENDEDDQKRKQVQEKIKKEKEYVKQIIKTQLDKIKKYEIDTYENILNEYNKIDKIKDKKDIEKLDNIKEKIIQEILKDSINKKLTLNLFKSILSNGYFGQQSFLNVVKNKLTIEEQEELMYKDYISNIIETDFLQEILEEKYTLKEIKQRVEEGIESGLLKKEMIQIYTNILKKYIKKEKRLEDIKKYIQESVFSHCCMCESDRSITSNYSEGNFVPLAVSSDNMKNFFWNQHISIQICDICKLILFCIPAGISEISKTVKENVNGKIVYREKEVNCFVNYDTNINQLLKTNNYLSQNSIKDQSLNNPYADLILNIVAQEKDLSEWKLQNIFIIEFETKYLEYSRIEYFNIKKNVARFFKDYAKSTLGNISSYKDKLQIIDYILKNRDIGYIINNSLKEELNKENRNGYNCHLETKIRLFLNLLKKEEINLDEKIKKNNEKIDYVYNQGVSTYKSLKEKDEENKLDKYMFTMIKNIRLGNKDEFIYNVIKLNMSIGRAVLPIFIDILKDTELDWKTIGYSYVSGLTSSIFIKKEKMIRNLNGGK